VFLTARLGAVWRGQPTRFDEKAGSSGAEGAAVRANVRALPAVAIIGTALYATALILPLVDVTSTLGQITVGILIGVSAAALVLVPAVVLFNRPRWAVPPHLRGAPGLIRDLTNRSHQ